MHRTCFYFLLLLSIRAEILKTQFLNYPSVSSGTNVPCNNENLRKSCSKNIFFFHHFFLHFNHK